jgi:hypothetical protein
MRVQMTVKEFVRRDTDGDRIYKLEIGASSTSSVIWATA